jgi:site-specific recombinase XerC
LWVISCCKIFSDWVAKSGELANNPTKGSSSDTTKIEILPTELSRDPIRADAIILLQSTNQILHLEFQTLL